ncbi:uncharacterized protein LOC124540145 isoform X3 [Vanessa cardui]|uniref:uncharacterized protein LOC124540145 isoform X3 n=1 Tax=Vanessa cardui TaxID=171605 RepID=UPI001F146D36|nr:uncharacterized protein LOC124540145 isoform X3 [Vanessa cardui]
MSFEVDRYTSAWAHIALCADLTWASEPPDDFIVANQRLWAQHCRVSHVLQETGIESAQDITSSNCDSSDKHLVALQDNGSSSRRSVKDVIPESRLAQFYGNFYYDDVRENCYTCSNEKGNVRYNGHGCENSDLTECWMLPEVEYWFRKLVDNSDRAVPRRRRQCKMLTDSDLKTARVPSPPPAPRKIRARRRQPRSLAALAPPPPAYCVDAPTKLFCDPAYKFQFDVTRPPQLTDYQRAMGRLSASVQALMRSSASRCPTYRGTNVSRYTPTIPRPTRFPDKRYGVWWPRENQNRLNQKYIINQIQNMNTVHTAQKAETSERKEDADKEVDQTSSTHTETEEKKSENINMQQKDNLVDDGQLPSTSAAAQEDLRKKRLYSTVLSTSVAPPIHLNSVGSIRLSKNLNTPGLIKLNSKIAVSSRIRIPIVDTKFEELEKEALEQYKDSDESIDTKFRELEKQAVEQYSNSNSNTSCSSDNSGKKKPINLSTNCEGTKEKRLPKSSDDKSVDSVVIYSQNFPDLNAKGQSNSLNLKNFHIPPRGEKKELAHRLNKCFRNVKNDSKRAASDTDNEARDTTVKGSKASKGSMRWTLHVMPPKKRHLTLSDFSSDEEIKENTGSIKDAGPCIKKHLSGKVKLSAHGGGDLHPIIRKT